MDEIDLIAIRFGVLYEIYNQRLEETTGAKKKALVAEYDGIAIRREPIKHSSFVKSAGYHPEHRLLDIEFDGGKVYRYRDVPLEFYKKMRTRYSLKDLNNWLKAFEFERIE